MLRIFGPNGAVACCLRGAVNIDRRHRVVLAIGAHFRSSIDLIRRRMDYRQFKGRRSSGHDARAIGINGERTLGLALSAVYGGVGCAVDNSRESRPPTGPVPRSSCRKCCTPPHLRLALPRQRVQPVLDQSVHRHRGRAASLDLDGTMLRSPTPP